MQTLKHWKQLMAEKILYMLSNILRWQNITVELLLSILFNVNVYVVPFLYSLYMIEYFINSNSNFKYLLFFLILDQAMQCEFYWPSTNNK